MSKKYNINGREFVSAKELRLYLKSLKNRLGELTGDDFNFMKEWFEKSQPQSCIPNIIKIYVAECWGQPHYTNHHFRVVREDGSDEELSYWPFETSLSTFSLACRRAVDAQIETLIREGRGTHAHHNPPIFSDLVKMFIKKYEIDIKKVEYKEVDLGKNYKAKVFKDGWMEERFRQFHQRNAKIIVISKEEHTNIHHYGL